MPETARHIRRVFQAFVASEGSAYGAVRALQALAPGQPGPVPPQGARWTIGYLLFHIRNPIYRRRVEYAGVLYDAPHLIPQVVSAALVRRADRLLAERALLYAEIAARIQGRNAYTYSSRLFCGHCGGPMGTRPLGRPAPGEPPRAVSWTCKRAGQAQCPVGFRMPQYRINALLAQGLAEFLDERAARHPLPAQTAADQAAFCRARKRLTDGAAHNRRVEGRRLEAYADGLLTDIGAVRGQVAELAARHARFLQKLAALEEEWADGTWGVESAAADMRRLQTRFERAWAGDWSFVHDPDKAAFLEALDIRLSVHIAERKTRYHRRPVPGRVKPPPRTTRKIRYGGLLTLAVSAGSLPDGEPASFAVTEMEEEYQAYR